MKVFPKLILICLALIPLFVSCKSKEISSSPLIFEIHAKDGVKQVVVQPNEIVKVGIDERMAKPQVVIEIAQKHHALIEKLTKENIGQKIVIRTSTETIFSGTFMAPLLGGKFAFTRPSVEEAETTIKKMGRVLDYRLKLTPEELDAAKSYTGPLNPWADKAINARTTREAEEYAKKAIQEEPNEAEYHLLLSGIYSREGKIKLALEEALTAERLSSEKDLVRFPGTYLSIAKFYTQLNEYGKAIEYLKKVLSNNENNIIARLHLAEIYEKIGKYDLAIQEYKFLLESNDEKAREKGFEGLKRLEEKQK